ncbi:MAG: glutaredoxin family protein [Methylococcales bacterium]|nr:glutaredoxin family protein [Methylococcales bacterium]
MHLILLGTAGCHLCEQAEEIIRECLGNDYDEVVETIDIAEQEHWQARYAVRIPVLYDPSSEKELAWRFEQAEVRAFIQSL